MNETTTERRSLTIIVAMTPGGVIGKDGAIPWKVSEDLKRFKALTTGHAIIMGRKTFQSIGLPLPNRHSVVLSSDPHYHPFATENVPKVTDVRATVEDGRPTHATALYCVQSFEKALEVAYKLDAHPFVIGGAQIYKLALPLATKLEVTYVIRDIAGDTFLRFPDDATYPSLREWRCTNIERSVDHDDVEFHTFVRR